MLYLYRKCPTLCFLEGEFNMRELLNSSVSIGLVFVVLVGCAISLVLLLKNKLKIQNNIKRFISFFPAVLFCIDDNRFWRPVPYFWKGSMTVFMSQLGTQYEEAARIGFVQCGQLFYFRSPDFETPLGTCICPRERLTLCIRSVQHPRS